MTRTGRIASAVVIAVLVTGLAGCSGDGPGGTLIGPPPTTTPVPPTTTPAPAPSSGPPTAEPGTDPTGGGGGAGGGDGTPDAPPRCTTAELTGSLSGGEGAAGSAYRTLVLTNTGARTCELTGFPGVSYVTGDQGQQVGPAAAMAGERGGPVRLDVGGSAGAQVRFVNVGNYDPAACVPTPVRGVRVYPPGDTASLYVPLETTGCAGTPPGDQLTVTTLTAR